MLVTGLVALIALITFQVRSILVSRFPGLRAVEALATNIPLFLLLFASAYLVMSTESAGSFSQQPTHTDALYFTVTVFSTVGFGDITAKTEAARLVVSRADDHRFDHHRDRSQNNPRCGPAKPPAAAGRREHPAAKRRAKSCQRYWSQLEPIATTAPRAANAAHSTAQRYSNGP